MALRPLVSLLIMATDDIFKNIDSDYLIVFLFLFICLLRNRLTWV